MPYGFFHLFILVVSLPAFAETPTPEPSPAPESRGVGQWVRNVRLNLFKWLENKPWVDAEIVTLKPDLRKGAGGSAEASTLFPDPSSGTGDGANGGNGSGGTGGSGSGAGSGGGGGGNGSGSGNSAGNDPNGGQGNGGRDPTADLPPAPGGILNRNDRGVAFRHWYPMCLFMDAGAVSQAQGNATVKGLIDDAAACQVNLVVFPIAVRPGSYPSDFRAADQVNQMQQHACNLVGNLGNAIRASTSMCVSSDRMADEMCRSYESRQGPNDPRPTRDAGTVWREEVAGCAQLAASPQEADVYRREIARLERSDEEGGNAADRRRAQQIRQHNPNDSFATGGVAPSIEDNGACTPGTVGHEALGHSMFGHPNGASAGHGIGFRTTGGGAGWTAEGCEAMRRNAFANDGRWRWDPNRQTYWVKPTDPRRLWDLSSGKQLFGPRVGPPPPGQGTPPEQGEPVPRIGFDDSRSRQRSPGQGPRTAKNTQAPPPGAEPGSVNNPTGADARHRRAPGPDTYGEKLIASLKPSDGAQGGGDFPPATEDFVNGPPPQQGLGQASPRIGFDDSAKKRRTGGKPVEYAVQGTRVGASRPGSAPGYSGGVDGVPYANVGSEEFDVYQAGGPIVTASGAGQGGGGPSIGFDDSRAKGANYAAGGGGRYREGDPVPTGGAGPLGSFGGGTTVVGAPGGVGNLLDGDFFNALTKAERDRRRRIDEPRRRPTTLNEQGPERAVR